MTLKSAEVFPLRSDTLSRVGTTCGRFAATAASVNDSDYHESLAKRNIYIERIDPPLELMLRARGIMANRRAGPQVDNAAVQKLVRVARTLRSANEGSIRSALSATFHVPDERLEMSANQAWSNSVPIALC